MVGQLSHETAVNLPASEVWEVYSTLRLPKIVEEELTSIFEKIELVEGDGGVGTVLKLTFVPGIPGVSNYKEKFTIIDNEKRIKETEVVEGGYLDMGFTLYRVRFEIFEKDHDSCSIKSTIEYDIKEEAAANASYVTIEPLMKVTEVVISRLIKSKNVKDAHSSRN